MNCNHCGEANDADSVFCKKCGRRLIVPHRPEIIDFERLLSDGYGALDAGRTGEALLAAEAILRCDPANTSALILKSFVHERTGDLEQAIDALEQVVALNPDSALDRQRLSELRSRRGYSRVPPTRSAPTPGSPLLAATLTGIVFLVLALAFTAIILRDRDTTGSTGSTDQTPAQPGLPYAAAPMQPSQVQPPSNPTPYYQPQSGSENRTPVAVSPSPSAPTGALLPPLSPIMTPGVDIGRPTESTDSTGPPTSATDTSTFMPEPPQSTKPSPPRSIIEVSVTPPGPSEEASRPPDDQESLNYFRIAQNLQYQGKYREAIETYRKALPGARYPGRIYQQIALCHYRLGELREAAGAYEQALAAYEVQLKAGYDVPGAQAGIAASRAGLRACRSSG